MPIHPRMDDPSKPRPSSNVSLSRCSIGNEQCCQLPSMSTNFTSTISASCFFAYEKKSSGVFGKSAGAISPPFVKGERYAKAAPEAIVMWGIANPQSQPATNRQSAIRNRQSEIGNRQSAILLFLQQRLHRIGADGAEGRRGAGERCNGGEHNDHGGKRHGISRRDPK